MLGSLGVLPLAPNFTGRLERWQKLSVAVSDAKMKQQGAWLTVTKSRRLRKLGYASGALGEAPSS